MKPTFEEIAREFCPAIDHTIFNTSHPAHQRHVSRFSDSRIAGLQVIIDYVLSNKLEISNPNTIDVTEFFLLGESFRIGYGLTEGVVGYALENRLTLNPKIKENLPSLFGQYKEVLEGKGNPLEENTLRYLRDKNSSNALSLLKGTYLMPKPNTFLFPGKKVIVTGSDTGIGREIALEFARREAKVALHYPLSERGAKSAEQLIGEAGKEARAFKGDFRNWDEIKLFAEKALDYLGGCDILVNNAGITLSKAFEETTPEQFDTLMNVNLKAMYFITQRVVPHMKKRGKGAVVNMASTHGISGKAGHSVYAATKGAVISLTRELAIELSPYIRVNAIAPGWVATTNHFKLLPKIDFHYDGKNSSPLGFIATPKDIANSVVHLSSDNSRFMTGQTITIDGGITSGTYMSRECAEMPSEPRGSGYVVGIE